ncbi:MAG: hypothetical protein JWL82_606 [Parcubacteria group bacterium]|nr:hypothetical protein [Parcubacteria group bacterium]
MPDNKSPKKGIFATLGSIGEAIAGEVMEEKPGHDAESAQAPPSPSPAPIPSVSSLVSAAQTPSTSIDPDMLARVHQKVFNVPSQVTTFIKMYEVLGKPQDISTVLNALQVSQPGLTGQVILQDLKTHLDLVDEASRDFDEEMVEESTTRLGGRDTEINDLNAKNTAATAEIARHQREITERTTRVSVLTQERVGEQDALARTKQRFASAEASVRSELLALQQRLGAL